MFKSLLALLFPRTTFVLSRATTFLFAWVIALVVFPATASATTPITGKVKNLGQGTVSAGTFVRFYLRGCAGNQPRVSGNNGLVTAIIAPTLGNVYYFDFVPDSTGTINGTLYSTRDPSGVGPGDIECGGSLTAVWYGMQTYVNGKAGPEVAIHANSGVSLDISSVAPITSVPVVTAAVGLTQLTLPGSTSGFTTVRAEPVASGVLTLPAATDTLVGLNTTDILTNKTLSFAQLSGTTINNTMWSSSLGSVTNPIYSFAQETTTGFYSPSLNQITAAVGGVNGPTFSQNGITFGTDGEFINFGLAQDTSLSRLSPGILAIGNGNQGDTGGTLQAARGQFGAIGGNPIDVAGGGSAVQIHQIGTGSGNGKSWSFALQNAGNGDLYQFGASSSTYTTGGVVGWIGNTNAFLYHSTQNFLVGAGTGTNSAINFDSSGSVLRFPSIGVLGFTSGGPSAANDTGISRSAAATVALGNGNQGDASGTLNLQNLTSPASGTANSTPTNFGSGSITFGSSVWNGTSAVSAPASLFYSPTQVTNPNLFFVLNFPNTMPQGSFFQLNNSKLATSGANVNSPVLQFVGQSWNGSASQQDTWMVQNLLGSGANPTNTLTFSRFGGTGAGAVQMPTLSFPLQAAPPNPPSGSITIYGDNSSQQITCRNSSGTSCLSATAAPPLISTTANPAQTGLVRAASGDTAVAFRNNANTADIAGLAKDTSDIVQVGGSPGMKSNSITATGTATLPTSCGGGAVFFNDSGSPNSADICFGDGTGWFLNFTKRTGSTSTSVASVKDTGVINASAGYQVGGAAANGNVLRGNGSNFVPAQLSAGDLSNGTSGSGAVVLTNSATPTFNRMTVNNGVANSGTGMMHVRATSCTTAALVNASCAGTVTWPGTWADTNYTAVCTPDNSGQSGTVSVTAIFSKTTTNMQVGIANPPGSSVSVVTVLNCIGIHD